LAEPFVVVKFLKYCYSNYYVHISITVAPTLIAPLAEKNGVARRIVCYIVQCRLTLADLGLAEYFIIQVILADQGAILNIADQGTIQQDYCIIRKMLADQGTMLHIAD
jgi:hypothetical protein